MIGTYASYRSTIDNMGKTLNRVMKQPQVERETDYYTKKIMSVSSVEEFLSDDRLYTYATKAWGLEDMSFAKGMMRKVLTDPDFANGLIDKRYRAFAEAFNFNKHGAEATEQDSATRATVNKYMQQTLETQAGNENPGTRLALYFTRTIGEMVNKGTLSKDSWGYQMISDKALQEVVYTALGIPDSVKASDVDGQKRMIESRMSYDDLVNPAKLEKLVSQFSARYDASNRTQISPALSLLQTGQGGGLSFSNDTMMAIQSLKFGA